MTAVFRRHWKRWLIGGVALIVVVAVGGPYVFIHFIEGPPKPKLALPSTTTVPSAGPSAATAPASVSGEWKVSSGSQAGYRVSEVLAGQSTTAVGRTSSVTGQFQISGTTVTAASFTVQMATVVSDQSQRDAQFNGRIMDVAQNPTAVFTLTKPIALGRIPEPGTVVHVPATGTLALHGTARTITISLSAERLSPSIEILGDYNIVFSDWQISNPSVGGFVTTANHGLLEVLLHLVKA
jgi:polyisoprenoid-binding protein YceI